MLKALADPLLSLIYPQVCNLCGNSVENADDGVVCAACWKATRIFADSDPLCKKCAALVGFADQDTSAGCRNCNDHSYDLARSVGVYEGALAASIIHFKK